MLNRHYISRMYAKSVPWKPVRIDFSIHSTMRRVFIWWRLDSTYGTSRGIFFAKIRVHFFVCVSYQTVMSWLDSLASFSRTIISPSLPPPPLTSPCRSSHRRSRRPYCIFKVHRCSFPYLEYPSDTSSCLPGLLWLISKTSKLLSTLIKFVFDPCPPSYSNHHLSIYIWHGCSSSTPIFLPNMP
jgi:hypothetical protein